MRLKGLAGRLFACPSCTPSSSDSRQGITARASHSNRISTKRMRPAEHPADSWPRSRAAVSSSDREDMHDDKALFGCDSERVPSRARHSNDASRLFNRHCVAPVSRSRVRFPDIARIRPSESRSLFLPESVFVSSSVDVIATSPGRSDGAEPSPSLSPCFRPAARIDPKDHCRTTRGARRSRSSSDRRRVGRGPPPLTKYCLPLNR